MDTEKKEINSAVVQRAELDKIAAAIRENTVALIEMGVVLTQLRNTIDHFFSKG